MDQTDSSASKGKEKKCKGSRRVWTEIEEHCLLNALKDLVSNNWKCDNGFRPGYQGRLETVMRQRFPGTDIREKPHINSKLQVWKKEQQTLVTLMSKSGIGWNDSTKMIEVKEPHFWDAAVKSDPSAKTMRFKTWPYLDDWCEIFGKDGATGAQAEDLGDIPPPPSVQSEPIEMSTTFENAGDSWGKGCDVSSKPSAAGTEASGSKQSGGSRKRKSTDGGIQELVDEIRELRHGTQEQMGELVHRMGFEFELSKKRERVFGVMGAMDWLNMEQRITVGNYIVNNNKVLEFFFSMPVNYQEEMVKMILDGKL